MNRTLDKVIGSSVLEAYDREFGLGSSVDVSKFNGLYSALSDKKSNYEARIEKANKILGQMQLSKEEGRYARKIMADTLGFMNQQREKRGAGAVQATLLEDILFAEANKRQMGWLKRTILGVGAAASILLAAAGISGSADTCYANKGGKKTEVPCWTEAYHRERGEWIGSEGKSAAPGTSEAAEPVRKTAAGKAGNPKLPTNVPTGKPTIEDLEVQVGNSAFTLTKNNSTVNVPYESDVYVRPQLKKVKTKLGDQPLRTEILLQVFNQKTNSWEYLLDAKGERHPINGRINLEDYGVKPNEKVKVQVTYETLTDTFQTAELYLVQGEKPQKTVCPSCPAPEKQKPTVIEVPGYQPNAPAEKATVPAPTVIVVPGEKAKAELPKPTVIEVPAKQAPKKKLTEEEEKLAKELVETAVNLNILEWKLAQAEAKARASYTQADLIVGFSNLGFQVPAVDPEVNAVSFGGRIDHYSQRIRAQLSGNLARYSMPKGDVHMTPWSINAVGKVALLKSPITPYIGAEGGITKVPLSENYRGQEMSVGYPQTSTTFGNVRAGVVIGDNGFAGNTYIAADVHGGILTIKDQVQGGVMGDWTRQSNSMLEKGATAELSIDHGRLRITGAASRAENKTDSLKSEAYRGSAEYRQPITDTLGVIVGASYSKAKTTQGELTISDTKNTTGYAALSFSWGGKRK